MEFLPDQPGRPAEIADGPGLRGPRSPAQGRVTVGLPQQADGSSPALGPSDPEPTRSDETDRPDDRFAWSVARRITGPDVSPGSDPSAASRPGGHRGGPTPSGEANAQPVAIVGSRPLPVHPAAGGDGDGPAPASGTPTPVDRGPASMVVAGLGAGGPTIPDHRAAGITLLPATRSADPGPVHPAGDGTTTGVPPAIDAAAVQPPLELDHLAPSDRPIDFIANLGQWDEAVEFVARDGPTVAAFADDAITLHLAGDRSASVGLAFEGTSDDATLVGEGRRDAYYNYFVGDDPDSWQSDVPAYASVRYDGLYDGVDVRVREGHGRLEYDLLLEPGADLGQVVLRADGAQGLEVAADGSLIVQTPADELRQSAPVTWEVLPDGRTRPVEARFKLLDDLRYGFEAPGWNPAHGLVVDPGLEWGTYYGGNQWEEVFGLAATNDGTGDVIIGGYTKSADIVATSGTFSPETESYIARFTAGGRLVYSTLFGSSTHAADLTDVAVDATGAPVVTGSTAAADYPTTPGAYDTVGNAGDAFVTRFNAAGTGLVFSTYLGGGVFDGGQQVAVAADGSVVVAGRTASPDFPTTPGAYDRTIGGMDLFVSRLSPDGSQLTYSTFLGGQHDEWVTGLVVDPQGFVTLSGWVIPEAQFNADGSISQVGTPFPTTPDAIQRNHEGNEPTHREGIVVRLKLDGAGTADLRYSTILGGRLSDFATGVDYDPTNPELVMVTGYTESWNFRTTPGVLIRAPLSADEDAWDIGFVSRFRFPAAGGGQLVWSTLLGGPFGQVATDVLVEPSGDAVVVGRAGMDFPTTERSYKRLTASGDAFVARVSADGKQIKYATLLGGSDMEGIRFMVQVEPGGPNGVTVGGNTLSNDFPTTPGAHDHVLNADGSNQDPILGATRTDAFLAKMDLAPNPTADTTAAPPVLLSPADGATFPAPTFENNTTTVPFDWTDVADESGVQAYQLAVSPDPDFNLNRSNQTEWILLEPRVSQADGQFHHMLSHWGRYYWRVRTLDNVNNWSPWSAPRLVNIGTADFQRVSSITASQPEVVGGGTITGTLIIQDRLAPSGGATFTLASNNPAVAQVPSSVTVPAGSDRVTFPITTSAVSVSTPVLIRNGDNFETEVIWVDPGAAAPASLLAVSLSPASVTGGSPSQGMVTLTAPAPAGGMIVTLSSSNTAAATVPASVTVPAGASSASFSVSTRSVTASTPVSVSAIAGGVTRSATLTVNPTASVTVSSIALSPPSVTGGSSSTGTVTLGAPAPAGGAVVSLSSGNTAVATVPASVTVPAGATSVSFAAATRSVTASTPVAISASAGGTTRSATLTVNPAAGVTLSSLTLSPTTVTGGGTAQGTVRLSAAAPAGGVVVSLASGNTAVATVPASVTVLAGSTSVNFSVTTRAVTASTGVTISATSGGVTRTATLTVTPQPTDTISITRAEYTSSNRELRIEATSTSGSAVLRAYVTATNQLIGTLTNDGGGRYRGQFTWSTNPQNVTVRSSLGGSASRVVTLK